DLEKYTLDSKPVPLEHSLEIWTTNEAVNYLENERDTEKPFFLHVSFERPHDPFCVSPECEHTYDPEKITLPENTEEIDKNDPIFFNRNVELKWCASAHGEDVLRQALCNYYSIISMIDDGIGGIVKCLEEQGLKENTIIVFGADHGDYAGEYSSMAKGYCYDAIHRVPFIWNYSDFKAGKEDEGLVQTIDMFPTLCELLGVPVPKQVQGSSLKEILTTADKYSEQEEIYYEFVGCKTVRTKEYKLNYAFDGSEKGQLFDLVNDPHEYNNLFENNDYIEIREKMIRKLLNWLITTQQPVMKYFHIQDGLPHSPELSWHVWKSMVSSNMKFDRNCNIECHLNKVI
ncbi:MAG: sulfatase family protein, partial [Planctomycetota bacterium]